MARVLVITNPSDDIATEYLDAWSEKIRDLAMKKKETTIFELRKGDATRKKLVALINKEKPRFIILNGHGDDNLVFGYGHDILIKCDDNEHILKEKIVHSLSCSSGKVLGPKCIEIGTLAYIGYKENFKLAHLNNKTKNEQLSDEVAALFLDPAFEAILALIEGESAESAYAISQTKYLQILIKLIAINDTGYNTVVASRLFHNYQHQVCLGDQQASF